MTDRIQCSAAPIYRDKHMATGSWWIVVSPEGTEYALCSGACMVTFATLRALPADLEPR